MLRTMGQAGLGGLVSIGNMRRRWEKSRGRVFLPRYRRPRIAELQKDNLDWTKWTAISGWIFTATAAGIFVASIWGLALMRQSIVEGNRAWLAPKNAILLKELKVGEPMQIEISYQNVGKSPAQDVREYLNIRMLPDPTIPSPEFNASIEADDICGRLEPVKGAAIAFPEQPEANSIQFSTKGPTEEIDADSDVMSGKKTIVIEMCLAYTTMSRVGHTSFCYFYRSGVSPSGQFNICPAGQRAD